MLVGASFAKRLTARRLLSMSYVTPQGGEAGDCCNGGHDQRPTSPSTFI